MKLKTSRYELQGASEIKDNILSFFANMSGDNTVVVDLIESIVLASAQIFRARDSTDVFLAACVFLRSRTTKPLLQLQMEGFQTFFATVFPETSLQAKTDEFDALNAVNDFRELMSKWGELKDTTIALKMTKVIKYMITFGVFTSVGIPGCKQSSLKMQESSTGPLDHVNFLYAVIDFATFTLQRTLMYARTGDWEIFLHGPRTYTTWFDKCLELKRVAASLGNLEAQGTTYFKFVHDMKECIETGKSIVRYSSKENAAEFRAARQLLNEVLIVESNVLSAKSAQQERRAPFGLLVFSGSSLAKSMFTKMLFYYYGKLLSLPTGDEYKFTRNPADPFWTGFTSQKWFIQLDDVGYLSPTKASIDLSLTELIALVNNVPLVPNQASLDDKGRTPVRCKLVIATSNAKDMNATSYFYCPLAVQRRLPWVITLKPKKEFERDDAPGMIDPCKMTPIKGVWPDYWHIIVEKVVPGGLIGGDRQGATHEVVHVFSDVQLFLDWFKDAIMLFEEIQRKAMAGDEEMAGISLCMNCNRPAANCTCAALQAGIEVLMPQGVVWGDDFRTTESDEGVLYTRSYSFVDGRYMCTTKAVHNEEVVSNYTAPCNVVRTTTKPEAVRDSDLADVLDEILRRQTQNLQGANRVLGACTSAFVSSYVRYPIVKRSIDYLTDFSIVRRFVCWMLVAHLQPGSHTRTALELIGKMQQKMYANRQWLTALSVLGVLGAAALMYSYFAPKKVSEPLQGLRQSVADEVFPKTQKENVWKRDDYEVNSFDVTPIMQNFATLEHDQIVRTLARNCARISVEGDKMIPANAFCVGGRLWVTTNHVIPVGDCPTRIHMQFDKECHGVSRNFKFYLSEVDLFRQEESDLVWFECSAADVRRDVTPLLMRPEYNTKARAHYIGFDRTMQLRDRVMYACKPETAMCTQLSRDMRYWSGQVEADTVNGDCGTILIHTSPAVCILGLHQLGGSNLRAFAVELTIQHAQAAVAHFGARLLQGGLPQLKTPSVEKKLGVLQTHAPVRWLEQGTLACFGTFVGFRPRPRSKVQATFLGKEIIAERGWNIPFVAPLLSDWRPWHLAYKDVVEQQHNIPKKDLAMAVESFVQDIVGGLSSDQLVSIQPLTTQAAINGIAGVRFIDKVNFNTSMGEPYNKSKKHFILPLPTAELTDAKVFVPEIMDEVVRIENLYERGSRACPVFSGQLKDEPRHVDKVNLGKVRVFSGAPVAWSIVVRKYTLAFVKVMQENPLLFESAPGCVVQSLEWEKFREYLCQFGDDQIVGGDYEKFDKKMTPAVILAAFEVMARVMRAAGWSDDEVDVIRCVAEDCAFPYINMNGELVMFTGSNPSGHPLTVIINCLVNSLYQRLCYINLGPVQECASFKQNVSLLTYGDDNAMGVSERTPWFNHTAISGFLRTIGVGYTMADKTSQSVPYISIRNLTFLKRAWRWDEEVGAFVAPLEIESIQKMLTVCVKSRTLGKEAHMAAVMISAMNEWFYYGREKFETESRWLVALAHKNGMLAELKDEGIPTWDQLYVRFWTASVGVETRRLGVLKQLPCVKPN